MTQLAEPRPAMAATDSFADFVRARTPALLRTAFLLTGDQHLAEDLVQSALTRTHRAWRRLRESDHAEAYTRRAMYHLQVSWWRRRRLPEALSADLPEPRRAVAADEDRTVLRLAVLEALRQLSPGQRAVLVLRYFDDLSEAQAADVLGVSVGTVKSQTSRALNRLRDDLAGVADLAQPADLHERVLSASRRAQARVRAVAAAVAIAVLVGAGVAVAVLKGPGPAIEPADDYAPVIIPSGRLESYDPTMSDVNPGDLAGIALDLPAFTGAPGCPNGRRTFPSYGILDVGPATLILHRALPTDVDGANAMDYVSMVECYLPAANPQYYHQVLVYTDVSSTGARLLGQVISSGTAGVVGVFDLDVSQPGAIRVRVGDRVGQEAPSAQLQWRTYAWQGAGGFAQTSGLTWFSPERPSAAMTVGAAAQAMVLEDGRRIVMIRVEVGYSGRLGVPFPVIYLTVPALYKPVDPNSWKECTEDREFGGETDRRFQCPLPGVEGQGAYLGQYDFLDEGPSTGATIVVGVDQRADGHVLETDLSDNITEFAAP